jgi:Holliday junction resolvase RusA-like endonuclease
MGIRMSEEEYAKRLAAAKARNLARARSEAAENKAQSIAPADLHPKTHGGGMIEFCVPGEPFSWMRATPYQGKQLTPKKMREHQNVVRSCAELAGCVPLDGPMRLEIWFYRSVPASWSKQRKRNAYLGITRPTSVPDLSNYLKEIEDALNGVAYNDDAQICKVTCAKLYHGEFDLPYTVVRITPMF